MTMIQRTAPIRSDFLFGAYVHSEGRVVIVEDALTRMGAEVQLKQRYPEQSNFSMRVYNRSTGQEL